MARRKVLSYRATANLAVAGGIVSLVALFVIRWVLPAVTDVPSLPAIVGVLGVVMWFLGTAGGLLAVSTPYKRRAAVGLALCGTALITMIVINYLRAQS